MYFRNIIPALTLLVPTLASNVLDLTPNNFDTHVFRGKPSLVEFFAPWCGHCKNLAPTWEQLADSLASNKDSILIAKVDGDEHKSLSTKYGISGFPTIKYFDGKSKDPVDYTGGRDLESFQKYITENAGTKIKKTPKAPSAVTYLTDKSFDSAIGGAKGLFVAFTTSWCGHCKNLAPIWEQMAKVFQGDASSVTIAKVDAEENPRTAEKYGVTGYPTIKYFPAGSTEPVDFTGGRSIGDLVSYVNEHAGLHRLTSGSLDLSAGTFEALDSLVKGVSGADIDGVIEKVTKALSDIKDTSAAYYLKVLEKVKANSGYLEKETSRLESLLKKGGLAPEKTDDLTRRLNVLKRFAAGDASFDDVKAEL